MRVAGTDALHDPRCARHVPVQLIRTPTRDHGTAYCFTLDNVDTWITDRIPATTLPSDCP
jgi:hypothetical protein